MALKEMLPWRWGAMRRWEDDDRPMQAFRRNIDALHREMDRLFEDMWHGKEPSALLPEGWDFGQVSTRIDETEDAEAYHVSVELPGMDQEDVEVTFADGVLTIKGEKKQEEEEKGKEFYRRERSYGAFRRTLMVPGEVDAKNIRASFSKGVLTVYLPKSEEAQRNVKRIEVSSS